MATYRITAPDGNSYDVTAPDNAKQEDVLAYAKLNYKGAQDKRKAKIFTRAVREIITAAKS